MAIQHLWRVLYPEREGMLLWPHRREPPLPDGARAVEYLGPVGRADPPPPKRIKFDRSDSEAACAAEFSPHWGSEEGLADAIAEGLAERGIADAGFAARAALDCAAEGLDAIGLYSPAPSERATWRWGVPSRHWQEYARVRRWWHVRS